MNKEENKPKGSHPILVVSGGENGLGVKIASELRNKYGKDLVIVSPEDYENTKTTIPSIENKAFKISAIELPFTPPLTRRERRKKERKLKTK